jgi:hypothetical protein
LDTIPNKDEKQTVSTQSLLARTMSIASLKERATAAFL